MKIDLEFAELHTPLFFLGKNFGLKLDPKKLAGLKLVFDEEKDKLHVHWSGRHSIIPIANVAAMTPFPEPVPVKEEPKRADPEMVRRGRPSAQVATPTGHVFAGEGAGQTGVSSKAII